jgi:hypothetical protein
MTESSEPGYMPDMTLGLPGPAESPPDEEPEEPIEINDEEDLDVG